MQKISDVVDELDERIAHFRDLGSPLGYFTACYRRTTLTLRSILGAGYFDDDARMERFDLIFARRFLSALDAYRRTPRECPLPWRLVGRMAESSAQDYTIMQHLSAAGLVHIQWDLGVAAADLARAEGIALARLEADYNRIDALLGAVAPIVYAEVGDESPVVKWIAALTKPIEKPLVDLTFDAARKASWAFATQLEAAGSEGERASLIDQAEARVAAKVADVASPSPIAREIYAQVRNLENHDVVKVIDELNQQVPLRFEGWSLAT